MRENLMWEKNMRGNLMWEYDKKDIEDLALELANYVSALGEEHICFNDKRVHDLILDKLNLEFILKPEYEPERLKKIITTKE